MSNAMRVNKEKVFWLVFALFVTAVAFSNSAKMERVSHEVNTATTR